MADASREEMLTALVELHADDILQKIRVTTFLDHPPLEGEMDGFRRDIVRILKKLVILYDQQMERLDLESIDPSLALAKIWELSALAALIHTHEITTGEKLIDNITDIYGILDSASGSTTELSPEDQARFEHLMKGTEDS